jgi:hypothetical protein
VQVDFEQVLDRLRRQAFIESWHLAANDVEFRSWTIRCFDLSEGEASFSYERHLLRGVRIGSMVAALY